MKNAPNVPTNVTPTTVISNKDWTFYKANTPYSGCNINAVSSTSLKLDEKTQILSPITQVCRLYEFGNDPNDTVNDQAKIKTNDTNINQLNQQVTKILSAEKDVWANYIEVGAIWFKDTDTLVPNDAMATDALMTGSFKLSNSTIETFTQTQSVMNNCFRCHNTEQRFPPATTMMPLPGLNIDISHIIVNGYFWEQE